MFERVLWQLLVQVVTRVRIQGYTYSRIQSDITSEPGAARGPRKINKEVPKPDKT